MTYRTFSKHPQNILNMFLIVFCFNKNHLEAESRPGPAQTVWKVLASLQTAVNLQTIFLNVSIPLTVSELLLGPHPCERRQSQSQHAQRPADEFKPTRHSAASRGEKCSDEPLVCVFDLDFLFSEDPVSRQSMNQFNFISRVRVQGLQVQMS